MIDPERMLSRPVDGALSCHPARIFRTELSGDRMNESDSAKGLAVRRENAEEFCGGDSREDSVCDASPS